MHIDNHGIHLGKDELRALLEFAATEKENPLAVVHFQSDGTHICAYSSNGAKAIRAAGFSKHQDACEGEWTVMKHFLDRCRKLLSADTELVLAVSGASLHRAEVWDLETREQVAAIEAPFDVASSQMTFPVSAMTSSIVIPTSSGVRCLSVHPTYLVSLGVVAKAACDSMDLYFGKTRSDPLVFESEGDETTWTGAIMPLREVPDDGDSKATEDGES
jgi:hypothetical protein